VRDVPIEERGAREVTHVRGRADDGRLLEIEVVSPGSPVANPAFDVTPARLVTGSSPSVDCSRESRGLAALYPDRTDRP